MGVLSRAVTPDVAISDVTNRFRAILITSMEKIINPEELILNLKRYSLGAPIFALSEEKDTSIIRKQRIFSMLDGVFYENSYSSTVLTSIVEYQKKNKLPIMGEYKLAGIDASVFYKCATYFDEPINFSKTELLILRYLIRSYPNPAKSTDILKYAFNPSRLPDSSCIKTHISIMNKKFREAFGENLTFFEPKLGYTVLTPQMRAAKKSDAEEIKV